MLICAGHEEEKDISPTLNAEQKPANASTRLCRSKLQTDHDLHLEIRSGTARMDTLSIGRAFICLLHCLPVHGWRALSEGPGAEVNAAASLAEHSCRSEYHGVAAEIGDVDAASRSESDGSADTVHA
jgi:hypothetical protein